MQCSFITYNPPFSSDLDAANMDSPILVSLTIFVFGLLGVSGQGKFRLLSILDLTLPFSNGPCKCKVRLF